MADHPDTAPGTVALTRFFRVGVPCAVADRGDERREARVLFDSPGTGTLADTVELSPEAKPVPIRVSEVSPAGVAFLSDRRFDRGDTIDLSFEDDAGGFVRRPCEGPPAERAGYGR